MIKSLMCNYSSKFKKNSKSQIQLQNWIVYFFSYLQSMPSVSVISMGLSANTLPCHTSNLAGNDCTELCELLEGLHSLSAVL